MKKPLAAALLLVASLWLNAQWLQTNGPNGGVTRNIVSFKQALYAPTSSGLLRSEDNGLSWSTVPWPLGITKAVGWITVVQDTLLVVTQDWVTDRYNIYRYTADDDPLMPSDSGLPDSVHLSLCRQINGMLFMGGSYSGLFKSTDHGRSWVQSDSGLPRSKYMDDMTEQDGILYLAAGDNIFQSRDSGRHWDSTGFKQSAYSLASFGKILYAGTGNGVFVSSDSGKTWKITPMMAYSLAAAAGGVYALPYLLNGIYRTIDTGKTWEVVDSTLAACRTLSVIGDTFLVSARYGVYRSADTGRTWDTLPANASYVRKVEIAGSSLFAVSQDADAIFESRDNGNSWSRTPMPFNPFAGDYAVCIGVHQNVLYTMTVNKLYRYDNVNRTWAQADSAIGPYFNPREFVSGASGFFARTYKGLYRSDNSGWTWTRLPIDTVSSHISRIVTKENRLYALMHDSVLVSSDSGNTWQCFYRNGSNRPATALTFGSNNCFLGTANGLMISIDNGLHWQSTGLSLSVGDIVEAGGKLLATCYVDSSIENLGSWISLDTGKTWAQVQTGAINRDVMVQLTADNGVVYANSFCRGVWKFPLADYAPNEIAAVENTAALECFPNPFNPATTLQYTLKKAGNPDIWIFNARGQCVQKLNPGLTEAGQHFLCWEAADLPAGLYFIRLHAGSNRQTLRTILLR